MFDYGMKKSISIVSVCLFYFLRTIFTRAKNVVICIHLLYTMNTFVGLNIEQSEDAGFLSVCLSSNKGKHEIFVLSSSLPSVQDTPSLERVVYCKDETDLAQHIHQFLVQVEEEHAKDWTLISTNMEFDLQKINTFLKDAGFPDMYHHRDGSLRDSCKLLLVHLHDPGWNKLRVYSIY